MPNSEDNPTVTPLASKPSPNPSPSPIKSQSSSSHAPPPNGNAISTNNNKPTLHNINNEFIVSAASKIASQPVQVSDPRVWGVVTAISNRARKRPEGMNMLLTLDQHCIGRTVEEPSFQIMAPAVSATHCKIYKKQISPDADDLPNNCVCAFLKDSSTNGTYLNWEKLSKSSPEAKLQHGDIISIAFAPHHEHAFAFVYREVSRFPSAAEGALLKRKADDIGSENKRLKGIGIGSSEGPISLNDFRSLQRSNTELRKQLENQVVTIESLRSETHAVIEIVKETVNRFLCFLLMLSSVLAAGYDHRCSLCEVDNLLRNSMELKELKESVSKIYLDQMKELQQMLEGKEKELADSAKISSEQKHAFEDLTVRLNSCEQSLVEANEIICSQKASITELKALLTEERDHRREEREKALEDMKSNVQRAQAEAQEEIKRISDSSSRRENELQEMIVKLQDSEKERGLLVENLRTKLEDARQKLVTSDNKIRQLEGLICEEQLTSNTRKKVMHPDIYKSQRLVKYLLTSIFYIVVCRDRDLDREMKRMRKELESEKQAAREEAWAKVSALELEISAAMRDLDFESRRLKAARERIMLRETQLRAFYSTTEEIQGLFAKQQEQLKTMQRTLEDEENYDNTSVDTDTNLNHETVLGFGNRGRGENINKVAKVTSSASAKSCGRDNNLTSSDEASETEKHDCNTRDQEEGQDTQEVEHTSAEHVKGGFGSEIYGAGAAPINEGGLMETEGHLEIDGVGTTPVLEGELVGTEQVIETESLGMTSDKNLDLNRCVSAGDTMQLDEENNAVENQEHARMTDTEDVHHSPNKVLEVENPMDDTEGTIKTSDLLASEVAGSWAYSAAPSVHGENDLSRVKDSEEVCPALAHDSVGTVAESQNIPPSKVISSSRNDERIALSEMIGIVSPDLKEQFSISARSNVKGGAEKMADSNSDTDTDTDNCTDNEEGNNLDPPQVASDAETIGSDQGNQESDPDDTMDEDNEGTEVDSPP
ncbi:hypothetical protein Leryth_025936 [Lithospermum erythrorhizon]|nr:hypothetical protein Leryth_025936 [Lithospermum erythrorhizon]